MVEFTIFVITAGFSGKKYMQSFVFVYIKSYLKFFVNFKIFKKLT